MRSASLHHKNSPRPSSEDLRKIQPRNSRSATENRLSIVLFSGTLRRETARVCGTLPLPLPSDSVPRRSPNGIQEVNRGFDSLSSTETPSLTRWGFVLGVSLSWGRVDKLVHQRARRRRTGDVVAGAFSQ